MAAANTRYLDALARKPLDRPPVWIMRQAGRYMPEFRALRAKHDFLKVCRTPELACEVTLQPLEPIGVDAAILFCDILITLPGMGLDVSFGQGGPSIANPIASVSDVANLRLPPAAEAMPYVAEAIKMVKGEIGGKLPLIGFAGSPWTLAAYSVEGGGSKDHRKVKAFMHTEPEAFLRLTQKLAEVQADHLIAQGAAGVDALQLFESWGGVLSPDDFRRFALPGIQYVIQTVKQARPDLPLTLYMNGAGHVLEDLAETGADGVGVDWRVPLDQAFARTGGKVAIMGNLDPTMLFAPIPAIEAGVKRMLELAGDRPGHIANLGHGILPETPVAHAQAFVAAVKAHKAVAHA